MKNCRTRLRSVRPKALFGLDGAASGAIIAPAILAAAGMNVAGQASAAGIQAAAATRSARAQADAIRAQATQDANATRAAANINAEALRAQNENANKLQEAQLDAQREMHQEDVNLQNQMQLNLQMLAGQENVNASRKEGQIKVKNGGRFRLRGGRNIPFSITDGGYAEFLGYTPEGYTLHELVGDTHNERHKTNGKTKTGIGVKFANGAVVEGEGAGNTPSGELVLSTPNDIIFLSRHTMDGFNPALAVKSGMNPIIAANVQESIKHNKGLNNPGSTRRKAAAGLIAGGINAVGNVLGGIIGTIQSRRAAKKLARAYNDYGDLMYNANMEAGNTLADAYSQMRGIDPSLISRSDFAASTVMPAVRSARVNVSQPIEDINRNANRLIRATNANTMSSAARLSRLGNIAAMSAAQRSNVYGDQLNREEQIEQNNLAAINRAAEQNAILQSQASRDYNKYRLSIAEYNADVANKRALGIGQARSNAILGANAARGQGLLGAAGAKADSISNIGNIWGSTLASAGNAIGQGILYDRNLKLEADWINQLKNKGNPNAGDTRTIPSGLTVLPDGTLVDANGVPYYLSNNRNYTYNWNK